jgi:hypothetical protein
MIVKISDELKAQGDLGAKNVYVVTTVDTEDPEDTVNELFMASDEVQLKDLVREEFVGEDDFMNHKFEEDWGCSILCRLLGTVS